MTSTARIGISLLAGFLIVLMVAGCGETFRPVAIPVVGAGPDPQSAKFAIVLSQPATGPGFSTNIDLSGDTNVGQVQLGNGPIHATTVVSNTRVVIANQGDNNLMMNSASSPLQSQPVTISLPGSATDPSDPLASPTFVYSNQPNQNVFVIMSGRNSIGEVSLATNTFTSEVALSPGANPVAMIGTADGNKLYVANAGNNTVTVIDAQRLVKLSDVIVGSTPSFLAISSDQGRVFVVNKGDGTVSEINTSSDTVTSTPIAVGTAPNFAFFDPKLLRLYVTNSGSDSVSIISEDTLSPNIHAVTSVTLEPGAKPVSVTALADGTRAYVANSGTNDVAVINTLNNTAFRTVAVGSNPQIIFSSNDSLRVAVMNKGSNTVTTIRTLDDAVSANVTVPATPVFMLGTP